MSNTETSKEIVHSGHAYGTTRDREGLLRASLHCVRLAETLLGERPYPSIESVPYWAVEGAKFMIVQDGGDVAQGLAFLPGDAARAGVAQMLRAIECPLAAGHLSAQERASDARRALAKVLDAVAFEWSDWDSDIDDLVLQWAVFSHERFA